MQEVSRTKKSAHNKFQEQNQFCEDKKSVYKFHVDKKSTGNMFHKQYINSQQFL